MKFMLVRWSLESVATTPLAFATRDGLVRNVRTSALAAIPGSTDRYRCVPHAEPVMMAIAAAVIAHVILVLGMALHASWTEPSKQLTKSTVQTVTRLIGVRIATRHVLVLSPPRSCVELKSLNRSTRALAKDCAHLGLLAPVTAIATKDTGHTTAPSLCPVARLG